MDKRLFEKRCRYSIRKFTVGAASVMIGATFFGAQTVSAAEENTPTPPTGAEQPANQPAPIEKAGEDKEEEKPLTAPVQPVSSPSESRSNQVEPTSSKPASDEEKPVVEETAQPEANATAEEQEAPLTKVEKVTAERLDSASAKISFSKSEEATEYVIERTEKDQPAQKKEFRIAPQGTEHLTFIDHSLDANKSYEYVVKAKRYMEVAEASMRVMVDSLVYTIDDRDSSIKYGASFKDWNQDTALYNKTEKYADIEGSQANEANDTATLKFTGTGIEIYGIKSSQLGQASVTLDGQSKDDIDFYDSQSQKSVLVARYDGLEDKEHTLKIQVKKDHKKRSGERAKISLDYFRILQGHKKVFEKLDDRDSRILYGKEFKNWTEHTMYKDTEKYEDLGKRTNVPTEDTTATLKFYGTGIRIYGNKNAWLGKMLVTIDGKKQTPITVKDNQDLHGVFLGQYTGLKSGEHTIQISVDQATAPRKISLDGFEILKAATVPVDTASLDDVSSESDVLKVHLPQGDWDKIELTSVAFENAVTITKSGKQYKVSGTDTLLDAVEGSLTIALPKDTNRDEDNYIQAVTYKGKVATDPVAALIMEIPLDDEEPGSDPSDTGTENPSRAEERPGTVEQPSPAVTETTTVNPGETPQPAEHAEQPIPNKPAEEPAAVEGEGGKVTTSEVARNDAISREFSLENSKFKRSFKVENGKLHTESVTNKLSNQTLVFDKDSKEFTIQFKKAEGVTENLPEFPTFRSENTDRASWTVTTSSEQESNGAEGPATFSLDNNPATIWHSRYGNGNGTTRQLPIMVNVAFPTSKDISTFIYTPRQSGDNGDIKEYKISVKKDGGEFTEVSKGTFDRFTDKTPKFISFEKQIGVKEVKLEILSSQNGQPFASAAEFDVSGKTVQELQAEQTKHLLEYQEKVTALLNKRSLSMNQLTVAKDGIKEETTADSKRITVTFQPYVYNDVPVSIKYVTELKADASYSQSHLEISVPKELDEKLTIETLDLQSYQLTGENKIEDFSKQENIAEMGGFNGFYAGLGQPVYVGSFYTGSEFPVALNTVQDKQLLSRYYSGKNFAQLSKDEHGVYHTWNTVMGVARSDDYQVLQQDFYQYLSEIGQKTYYRKQYNSWFDHMKNITAENIKESFDQVDRGFTRGGISPLDSYVVDDGWQNVRSLWEFNQKFPNKLYDSSRQTGRFGSHFGLWLGPQGGYGNPGEMADALVKENKGSKHAGVVYIGDKRYVDGLQNRFKEYDQKFGINYWKLDGLLLNPKASTDDYGIGGGYLNMYSMTETHERWIDLYKTIRENATDPDKMWINLTSYIPPSPWFLQWVNSIWMQNSGDVDYQDGVKKEQYRHLDFGSDANEALTYRDDRYEELVKLRKWQLPFANIYNHDPVYGNTANSGKRSEPNGNYRPKINFTTDELRTYLYMLGTRGTGFWEFYYSPSMMDDDKWQVNGEAVNWIENNYETLKHARFHGGKPGHGEIYGYSAWDKDKGIVSVRNPINKEQTYTLKLDRLVGLPENISNLYRKVVLGDSRHNTTETTKYGDSITLTLKPYETVIFEYSKTDDTKPAELQDARVSSAKTIQLTFDEKVTVADAHFTVEGKTVEKVVLNPNLRTVTLNLKEELKDKEVVKVHYTDVKDGSAHENKALGDVTATAYDRGRMLELTDAKKGQTLKGGFSGKGAFSVTVKATLKELNQTLAKQGDEWRLSVDDTGRVTFSVKDLAVKSAPYTTLKEDDRGKADELLQVDKEFVVTAMRQTNGSLRLYINGQLHNTAYDKSKVNENLTLGDVTLGSTDLKGEISHFILENQALDFKEANDRRLEVQPQPELREVAVKVATVTSYDENDGGPRVANDVLDNDKATYWASNPNKDNNTEKQTITLELEKSTKVVGVVYTPRQVANAVGNVKQLYLEVSADGQNWQRAQIVDGENDNTKVLDAADIKDQTIAITPIETKFIRLTALHTAHWNSANADKVVAVAGLKALYEHIPEKTKPTPEAPKPEETTQPVVPAPATPAEIAKPSVPVDYNSKYHLTYDKPAATTYDGWEKQALPVGNGEMGAKVFGLIGEEKIQYNEKTLWSGGPRPDSKDYNGGNYKDRYKVMAAIRKALEAGNVTEAKKLAERNLVGPSDARYGRYLSFGDIKLDFTNQKKDLSSVTDYHRGLDISTAVTSTSYTQDGTTFARETFSSFPDDVTITHLTQKGDKKLDFTLGMDLTRDLIDGGKYKTEKSNFKDGTVTATADGILLKGTVKDNGLNFASYIGIKTDGRVTVENNHLKVAGASYATLLLSAKTDFAQNPKTNYRKDIDVEKTVKDIVTKAKVKDYQSLKDGHIKDYQALFNRVKLNLGGKTATTTTKEQLAGYKPEQGQSLEELFFQYGRYLLITSSRDKQDALPANLQGVWNGVDNPPWNADYHLNVNLQMNYWPVYSTNLAENAKPLINYIDDMRYFGRIAAKEYAGIESKEGQENGWLVHTQATPFGWTTPGWNYYWGWSPAANAWIMQNVYDHYKFTHDEEYLKDKIYPMLKETAKFWNSFLHYDKASDRWVSSPSYSPEHGTITIGNTFDQSLVWQLFHDYMEAANHLNVDQDFVKVVKTKFDKLKPLHINKAGQIKEWYEEDTPVFTGEGVQKGHRHASHLVGLFPGTLFSKDNPEYLEAARASLNDRGDGGTGWSKANKINLWARLLDGNRAHRLLAEQLRSSTLENLWDTHAPFQIDGNFGATSGMTEMLLQSHTGYVAPLPALPDAWKDGEVSGLVARGNFETSMKWVDKNLEKLSFTSNSGGDLIVDYPNIEHTLVKVNGQEVKPTLVKGNRIQVATQKGDVVTFENFTGRVTTLTAERKDSVTAALHFNKVQGATHYIIERTASADEGQAPAVRRFVTNDTHFVDRTIDSAHTYSYKVQAILGAVETPVSDAASIDVLSYVFDDRDERIKYGSAFENWSDGSLYGGTEKFVDLTNKNISDAAATATLSFTGVGIEVYGLKSNQLGLAKVTIDGKPVTEMDFYDQSAQKGVLVGRYVGLSDGPHTMTITVKKENKGRSNERSKISLDYFKVLQGQTNAVEKIDDRDTRIQYGSAFADWEDSELYGGTEKYADINNSTDLAKGAATATIPFTGTGIRVYGLKTTALGKALVTLDGKDMPALDFHTDGATKKGALIGEFTGLSDGPHTLTLTVDPNSSQGKKKISLDSFEIIKAAAVALDSPSLGAITPKDQELAVTLPSGAWDAVALTIPGVKEPLILTKQDDTHVRLGEDQVLDVMDNAVRVPLPDMTDRSAGAAIEAYSVLGKTLTSPVVTVFAEKVVPETKPTNSVEHPDDESKKPIPPAETDQPAKLDKDGAIAKITEAAKVKEAELGDDSEAKKELEEGLAFTKNLITAAKDQASIDSFVKAFMDTLGELQAKPEQPSGELTPDKPAQPRDEESKPVSPVPSEVKPVTPSTKPSDKPTQPVEPDVIKQPTAPVVTETEKEIEITLKTLKDKPTGVQVFGRPDDLAEVEHLEVRKVADQSLAGKQYDAYDIKLKTKDNHEVQPKGMVMVSLPIKVGSEVENVFYVTPTKDLKPLDFIKKSDRIEFMTNHFSIYAVVYKQSMIETVHREYVTPVLVEQVSTKTDTDISDDADENKTIDTKSTLPNTGENKETQLLFLAALTLALSSLFFVQERKD